MTLELEDIAGCGGISLIISIMPTMALIISEILPYVKEKNKCNGIIQTIVCLLGKNECISIDSIDDIEEDETDDETP